MSKRKPKRLKESNNKNIKLVVSIVFFIIFIICISYLIYNQHSKNKDKEVIEEIQKYEPVVSTEETPTKTETMLKVAELHLSNPDIKGWIKIDNTIIDYPVVQGEDDDYYLTHDYKKEKNKYGSIFLKSGCDFNDINSNLIIYGHNMKDDNMFNSLLKYENKAFYDEKNVFRYYDYLNFNDENKYNEYINNVKKEQLYDTGITANYGEQLLTLITCEYSQENGRVVVVAKRI